MGGNQMSAREAKNPATQRFGKIDDLLKVNTKVESKDDININTNVEVKDKVKVEVDTDINEDIAVDIKDNDNKLAALKDKMKKNAKKESNKQVTIYLTPKNYKRFNVLKEKGQKSELINQLLDLYFDE